MLAWYCMGRVCIKEEIQTKYNKLKWYYLVMC
jgi:hypothetical protein